MCRATPVRRCCSIACWNRALRFSRNPSRPTSWRARLARCSTASSFTDDALRLDDLEGLTGLDGAGPRLASARRPAELDRPGGVRLPAAGIERPEGFGLGNRLFG